MSDLKFKVSRDPVHGEIYMFPLELLCADTRPLQRLRKVSQLAGAERVYPSATHTRFLHSLGVMHVCGEYAGHLEFDHKRTRILRLAGLVHDIGHGPFSHQFDETVYRKAGIKDGHDEQREKFLKEYLPGQMMDIFRDRMKSVWKENIIRDLNLTLGKEIKSEEDIFEGFKELMDEICAVFDGERYGSVDFNIVQGPLGADRMDFIMRDAYYCGTVEYGTIDLKRVIRYSSVSKLNSYPVLSYSDKIMDSIYSVLFGRFMMYKNVYFHKTARAADMMLQKALELSYDFLGMYERVNDPEKFVKLTEEALIFEIESYARKDLESGVEHSDAIEAFEILDKYSRRNLWKNILEISFSTTGVDPSRIASGVGEDALKTIRSNIDHAVNSQIPEEDKKELACLLENFCDIFKIDTPYKLSLAHPAEFLATQVFLSIKNEQVSQLVDFEKYLSKNAFYKSISGSLVQMVRIYVTTDCREILNKYEILPSDSELSITTRW